MFSSYGLTLKATLFACLLPFLGACNGALCTFVFLVLWVYLGEVDCPWNCAWKSTPRPSGARLCRVIWFMWASPPGPEILHRADSNREPWRASKTLNHMDSFCGISKPPYRRTNKSYRKKLLKAHFMIEPLFPSRHHGLGAETQRGRGFQAERVSTQRGGKRWLDGRDSGEARRAAKGGICSGLVLGNGQAALAGIMAKRFWRTDYTTSSLSKTVLWYFQKWIFTVIETGELKAHVRDQAVRNCARGPRGKRRVRNGQWGVMEASSRGSMRPGIILQNIWSWSCWIFHQCPPLFPAGKTKGVFNIYIGTAENCQNMRHDFPFHYG